ncbi:MAG: O-antigen ligase family protein [Acutalibacteraceae bacterium]|nr:O-antigen ligase family protein [Acutalibacteraceae bacterium]
MFLNPENLIYVAFVSVFLHFVVTAAVILAIGFYLLISKKARPLAFCHPGKGFLLLFVIYTMAVALVFKNFIGLACSVGFFLIVLISYYTRSVVTEKVFERCLDICCYVAIPLSLFAAVEKFLSHSGGVKLWFFNENYFCSLMAASVLICAYKATSHKGPVLRYYICAVFGAAAMYFGASLFAFVEVFVGLCVLLILQKKHLMLTIFLMGVVACLIIIYFVPDLFPRLSESNVTTERRIRIWNEAMVFIKENPLFGRGFLSYYQYSAQNPHIYQTTHAHNFAVEGLLSFGIIGSFILLLFLWSYYKKISECKELLRSNCATTLILTISAAVLIHMTTDMTLMWLQTGLLYALIMGGLGIDEKALNKRITACAGLGGKSDRGLTENK